MVYRYSGFGIKSRFIFATSLENVDISMTDVSIITILYRTSGSGNVLA